MDKIGILTGAGISAESGLGTLRDKDGLWTKYPLEDVATPEGFARDPALVQDFYNVRRKGAAEATPNAAHFALAKLQQGWPGDVVIVTQNVDGLHEKGGARDVIHMHGEIAGALCAFCGHRWTVRRRRWLLIIPARPATHRAAVLMWSGSGKSLTTWM